MNFEVIAPGIVKFSNCFDVTDSEISELKSQVDKAFEDNYSFIYDDDGSLMNGVNKSFHIVPAEHIFSLPVSITLDLNYDLVVKLEESIHQTLVKYVCMFPDALRSVWWRTVGHVVAYPAGTCLDLHSDNDVNYRPGTIPYDQAAVQHVISCTAVLNDDFDGGDIYFEYYGINVPVRRGEILFFPSNYVGTHCVKLIQSGTRLSYVSWYGHGSPDESRQIVARYVQDVGYKQGKIWMDHLYDDCAKLEEQGGFIKSRVFDRALDH